MNELDKLNNRHKIIIVIQFKKAANIPEEITGYKGFETILDFTALTGYDKLPGNLKKLAEDGKMPIGQLLNSNL